MLQRWLTCDGGGPCEAVWNVSHDWKKKEILNTFVRRTSLRTASESRSTRRDETMQSDLFTVEQGALSPLLRDYTEASDEFVKK